MASTTTNTNAAAPANSPRPFLGDDFLLENDFAAALYHEWAASCPIIDYHCHLSPADIAADRRFGDLTEIWLEGDHYKWRAMRAAGVPEHYITGPAPAREKFERWAFTVPATVRNPLFHWTHLELRRYFDIKKTLNPDTAPEIWESANARLPALSTHRIFEKMNVEVVCTTDDPTDDLSWHRAFRSGTKPQPIRLFPAFRPDKAILIENPAFLSYIEKLGQSAGVSIHSSAHLFDALDRRMDFFEAHGCCISDHGLEKLPAAGFTETQAEAVFQKRLSGREISPDEAEIFQAAVLHHLGSEYARRGWVQQFHLGALRNNNSRLLRQVGADAGCDSIGDFQQAPGLSRFLNRLDSENRLAKTILYNLNPADNEVFATMAGNFNDGSTPGKIQWGSAWWFLDQKDGMEKQINTLSNLGLLARFVGMLTDSRSFLSFPRHEYFRRILCNLIGRDVRNGELPPDFDLLGPLVRDVCYQNAKNYFNFEGKQPASII
jgi:glucuronate isomerase